MSTENPEQPLLPVVTGERGRLIEDTYHDRPVVREQVWKRDILKVDVETVIPPLKNDILTKLSSTLGEEEKRKFALLSNRISSTIRSWYHRLFETILNSYQNFDSQNARQFHITTIDDFVSSRDPNRANFSGEAEIEKAEALFLRWLLFLLQKGNYSLVTDADLTVALGGSYLLNLPIQVDFSKLDSKLLKNFYKKHPLPDSPNFANEYLIFKRGIGLDSTTDWFIFEKIDLLVCRIWDFFANLICCTPEGPDTTYLDIRKDKNSPGLSIERIRLENFKLRHLFSSSTIQEPTFERMILIYRLASETSITLKQFRNIPMADMEIVLFAVVATVSLQFSWTVVLSVLTIFASYALKVYLAWESNMSTYSGLLKSSMYDKHIDSGRATLLHLFDDVILQEELQSQCESFLEEEFLVKVKFEGMDAVSKLQKLGLVKNVNGKLRAEPLEAANEIIGETTDERFCDYDLSVTDV